MPDASNAYGSLAPTRFVAVLIKLAQRCPHNWFGRQLALILRKIVCGFVKHPVDTAVGAIRLRCSLHDNISERKFLFLPWLYDPEERRLIARQLPRDGVFVDIGANVGIYTLWACQYLSRRGLVVAVEPNPPVHDRLLFNLRINQTLHSDWPTVRTLPIAIGDKEECLDLNQDSTNLGASSLVRSSTSAGKIQVHGKPLLSVFAECGVDRIDILKIDIEGAEDIALTPFLHAAGDRLLPRYLIIENSERLWRSDLVSVIKSRGYTVAFRTRMNTVYRLAEMQSRA